MLITQILPEKIFSPTGSYTLQIETELNLCTLYYTNDRTGRILPLLTDTTPVLNYTNAGIIHSFLILLKSQGVASLKGGELCNIEEYIAQVTYVYNNIRGVVFLDS